MPRERKPLIEKSVVDLERLERFKQKIKEDHAAANGVVHGALKQFAVTHNLYPLPEYYQQINGCSRSLDPRLDALISEVLGE